MKNKQNIKSVEIANEIKALLAEENNKESAAGENNTQQITFQT